MGRVLYEGLCLGGPLNGEIAISRFPRGFLYIDRQSNKCCIYDWREDTHCFAVRQEDPMPVDEEGRYRAAIEFDYDVRAGVW